MFLSFKEKKENRLVEALSETLHSPLFTLRFYANSVQNEQIRACSGLLVPFKGFKLRFHKLFHVKLGFRASFFHVKLRIPIFSKNKKCAC